MSKAAPRPATSPSSAGGDVSVAALALLAGAILVALLLIFSLRDDGIGQSGSGLVTVQEISGTQKPPSPGAAAVSIEASIAQGPASGPAIARGLSLAPRSPRGLGSGYVVGPNSDPKILSATRLSVGDVLMDVDGEPLDGRRIAGLQDELASLDRLEFSFERNGEVRSRTIELARD